jgi:hypothetical protein
MPIQMLVIDDLELCVRVRRNMHGISFREIWPRLRSYQSIFPLMGGNSKGATFGATVVCLKF